MKPTRTLVALIIISLIVLGWVRLRAFMIVDSCLDMEGSWNYETRQPSNKTERANILPLGDMNLRDSISRIEHNHIKRK